MASVDKTNEEGDFPVRMMDDPTISIIENLQKEKQIVVDPLSIRNSPIKQGYPETTMFPTIITTCAATTLLHPPPLQPPKPRFLSLSLPNSANSSPRFASALSKKKSKGGSPEPQCQEQEASNFTQKLQHLLQEVHLRKSKSCGEGRAACAPPSDEFDHWLTKPSAMVEHDKWHHGSFSKTEGVKDSPNHMKTQDDDGFKCSALCLYLPGFGGGNKVKPVKARKEVSEREGVMSRTVSLENFECGSWASAAIFHEMEGDSANSYFDLPMELIKCSSASEVYSSVAAASFVYEKDLKGVLKNSSSRANVRKSDASPRHVRFSTSSPASPASCISPRLRKAREDFNAFLAAQSA